MSCPLSTAGLAGPAPCGSSMVPGWTWSPWYVSKEVSCGTTAQCQPLCSPAVGCWGAQMHFPCLSCSTQLMETPQEARGSSAHRHEVQQPGNCDVRRSEQQHQEARPRPPQQWDREVQQRDVQTGKQEETEDRSCGLTRSLWTFWEAGPTWLHAGAASDLLGQGFTSWLVRNS